MLFTTQLCPAWVCLCLEFSSAYIQAYKSMKAPSILTVCAFEIKQVKLKSQILCRIHNSWNRIVASRRRKLTCSWYFWGVCQRRWAALKRAVAFLSMQELKKMQDWRTPGQDISQKSCVLHFQTTTSWYRPGTRTCLSFGKWTFDSKYWSFQANLANF